MDYTSHSDFDRAAMLERIGASSLDELIDRALPREFRASKPLNLPDGISEFQLVREFSALADQNRNVLNGVCLLGGGAYDHYIPAAIPQLLLRSEFYTAYTPYQAEVAQGTLQTIYEFQSQVCRLTGMDVASASHYDGASAIAEGLLMGVRKTKRNLALVSATLNPAYRQVIDSYCRPAEIEVQEIPAVDGVTNVAQLKSMSGEAAAVVAQHPNYFGLLEPVEAITEAAKAGGALMVGAVNPTSLALLKPPGEWGADVCAAEGQPLGVPLSLGGPYVGFLAVKQDLVRMIPGRLVARAKDSNGRDGFVLTLQTREQHIRREKATSNICTNEALIALATLIYLSLVGPDGLKRAATNSYRGAHYLARELAKIPGCKLRFKGDFFHEFTLELPRSSNEVIEQIAGEGYFAGPALGRTHPEMENCLLIAVTEKRTRDELDGFAAALKNLLQ